MFSWKQQSSLSRAIFEAQKRLYEAENVSVTWALKQIQAGLLSMLLNLFLQNSSNYLPYSIFLPFQVIEFAEGFKFLYLDPTEVDDMWVRISFDKNNS